MPSVHEDIRKVSLVIGLLLFFALMWLLSGCGSARLPKQEDEVENKLTWTLASFGYGTKIGTNIDGAQVACANTAAQAIEQAKMQLTPQRYEDGCVIPANYREDLPPFCAKVWAHKPCPTRSRIVDPATVGYESGWGR